MRAGTRTSPPTKQLPKPRCPTTSGPRLRAVQRVRKANVILGQRGDGSHSRLWLAGLPSANPQPKESGHNWRKKQRGQHQPTGGGSILQGRLGFSARRRRSTQRPSRGTMRRGTLSPTRRPCEKRGQTKERRCRFWERIIRACALCPFRCELFKQQDRLAFSGKLHSLASLATDSSALFTTRRSKLPLSLPSAEPYNRGAPFGAGGLTSSLSRGVK